MAQIHLVVTNLHKHNATSFDAIVLPMKGVISSDTWKGKAMLTTGPEFSEQAVIQALARGGFHARTAESISSTAQKTSQTCVVAPEKRPTLLQLAGFFAIVWLIGKLFAGLGLTTQVSTDPSSVTFVAALLIGLVAGSSSCLAVSGGLLLSTMGAYRERCKDASIGKRMRPLYLFVAGRIVGYTVLGGLIGAVGKALSPSPTITAILMLVAAVYMFVMGLDMLHITPKFLKRLMPQLMPTSIGRQVLGAKKDHWAAPFLLGAATFFLPCGFTQTFQVYALTTGSFSAGAMILGGFALGTAPALLALGWASSSLKGKAGVFFMRLAGAAVVVLGLFNIQNAFAVAGYPISLSLPRATTARATVGGADLPEVVGGKQQVNMTVTGYGYSPEILTVKAGTPVAWNIDMQGGGCLSVIQAPQLGVRKSLAKGKNVIEFTAPKAGTYAFSCSMGMFRGEIHAI